MDLWEEEEDADDARPTIVAERPTADQPDVRARTDEDASRPVRPGPNSGRSGLVQRLIEQGALEDDPLQGRPSAEALRNSEVDELTVLDDKEAFSAAYAQREEIAHVESEPATEDAVPTVSVRRPLPASGTPLPISSIPLPASSTPLPTSKTPLPASATPLPTSKTPLPASATPRPAPAPSASSPVGATLLRTEAAVASKPRADRDVTERISIPSSGMVGSIAPATRTFRPGEQRKAGLPLWQTALAAVVLLGGGLTIAKLRNERTSRATAVSATAIASRPAMPSPAAEPVAAPSEPVALAEAPAPVAEPPAEPPAQPLPSAVPDPIVPPAPSMDQPPSNAARKLRVSRVERRALAAAEPDEPLAAAPEAEPALAPPAEVPAAPGLPAQPSRDQVTAALNAVVPALQKCVGDRHDTADVTLTVRPGGFVSYAVVSGAYAGSSEGSCIARAVKAAKFPAFSDPSVRINYPFQL